MPESPLQTLLRYMGQQQPNFLPQPQAQPLPPMAPAMVGPEQPRFLPPQPGMQQREQAYQQVRQQMRPWFQGGQGGIEKGSPVLPEFLFPQGRPQDPSDFALPTTVGPPVGLAAGAASRLFGKGMSKLPPAVTEGWQRWRTAITDFTAPLWDFTSKANLPASEDPAVAARLFAGHLGKVQNKLDALRETLEPFSTGINPRKWGEQKKLQQAMEQHAVLDRMREQALFGIDKFPGGKTSLDIINEQRALEATLTPEQLKLIKAAEPRLVEHSNDVLLEAMDSGLIDKQIYQDLTTKYKKYVPLHVVGGKLEAAEKTGFSGRMTIGQPDVLHAMTGSTKEVASPVESIVRNTYRIMNQAERNRVALKVANLETHPDFAGTVLKVADPSKAIPDGFGRIPVWRGGEKGFYDVPIEVADTLNRIGKQEADLFTQWASKSTALLRSGATSLNLAFIPSNAIRDFMTAKVVARGAGTKFTTMDWVGGLASALKKDQAFRDFLESGASFSGYNLVNQPLKTSAKQLFRGKRLDTATTLANPLAAINWLGQQIEYAPRLGMYKRGMRGGLDPFEAAFQSRNLTVDFARAGNLTKLVNLWVPFLNARMQGTINVANAFTNSKTPAAAIASASAMIGLPTVATYLNNTQRFPEIWGDIAQFEKDNNFLLIYGDALDERGNPTEVLKIPKGDIGKMLAGPLEAFLQYMDGYDPKSTKALFMELVSEASPIPFTREGKLDPTRALSSVLPPTVKAAGEVALGKNFYTGRDIDPIGWTLEGVSPEERYYWDTPKWAVGVSHALSQAGVSISPLRIMNAVGTQFGGLGRQIADPERAGQTIVGKFVGARGGEIAQKQMESLDKLTTVYADQNARLERKAAEEWAMLKDPSISKEKKDGLMRQWSGDVLMQNEIGRLAMREVVSPMERKLQGAGPIPRAEWIADYFSKLSPQQVGFMMARWEALGILSKETKAALAAVTKRNAARQ